MTKPANMTGLTERLRYAETSRPGGICEEAAAEIDRLQATVAGLRKSAALRVQFHAAELADVTAERDMWKKTLAQRDRELASARASDVHSCGPTCTRAGCVAAGLREEVAEYQNASIGLADAAVSLAERMRAHLSPEDIATVVRLRDLLAARKAAP